MTPSTLPFTTPPAQPSDELSQLQERQFALQVGLWQKEADLAAIRAQKTTATLAVRNYRLALARVGREYRRLLAASPDVAIR